MKKKIGLIVLLLAFTAVFLMPAPHAFCDYKSHGKSMQKKGLEGKVLKSAYCMLKKRKDLELTDEQVKQIKALKVAVKKDLIRRNAEIETLGVEIDTLMWETPFDVEAVNNLIAQKYKLKTEKAQYLVSAKDKLNKILTKEQMEKYKD